jgi:hypothetical protein
MCANTKKPRSTVSVWTSLVFGIYCNSRITKVVDAAIQLIAVDVVNYTSRPSSIRPKPNKTMGEICVTENHYPTVSSSFINRSGNIACNVLTSGMQPKPFVVAAGV